MSANILFTCIYEISLNIFSLLYFPKVADNAIYWGKRLREIDLILTEILVALWALFYPVKKVARISIYLKVKTSDRT